MRILNLFVVAALTLAGCGSGSSLANCRTLTGNRQLAGSGLAGVQSNQIQIEVRFVALDDTFAQNIGIDFTQFSEIESVNGFMPGARGDIAMPVALDSEALGGPDGISYLMPNNHTADSFLGYINFNFVPAFGDVQVFPQLTGTEPNQCLQFDVSTYEEATGFPGVANVNLPARSPGLVGDFLAWEPFDQAQFDSFLAAVEADTNNQILSAPRIVTLNQQRALIAVDDLQVNLADVLPGFRSRIEQNTSNPFGIFTGPTLDVRPHVVPGTNNIALEVYPGTRQVNAFRSQAFNVNGVQVDLQFPVVEPTTIRTSVTVPDGGTLLIGGLRRQNETEVEQGVPLLGDIPVLGNLFGTGKIQQNQTTLMILVTTTIITPTE